MKYWSLGFFPIIIHNRSFNIFLLFWFNSTHFDFFHQVWSFAAFQPHPYLHFAITMRDWFTAEAFGFGSWNVICSEFSHQSLVWIMICWFILCICYLCLVFVKVQEFGALVGSYILSDLIFMSEFWGWKWFEFFFWEGCLYGYTTRMLILFWINMKAKFSHLVKLTCSHESSKSSSFFFLLTLEDIGLHE